MKRKLLTATSIIVCLSNLVLLSACASTPPPDNPDNVCKIFEQYPQWYQDAKASRHKWGIPISVQMAIIYQESSYQSKARPPRTKILFVIPWKHPTSAYGYSQAIDHTWGVYERSIARAASRSNFADATDFIGWYADRAREKASIPPNDAYRLYLSYHEGITNYKKGSYRSIAWLTDTAKRVSLRAKTYRNQLLACEKSLPQPHSHWWQF